MLADAVPGVDHRLTAVTRGALNDTQGDELVNRTEHRRHQKVLKMMENKTFTKLIVSQNSTIQKVVVGTHLHSARRRVSEHQHVGVAAHGLDRVGQ